MARKLHTTSTPLFGIKGTSSDKKLMWFLCILFSSQEINYVFQWRPAYLSYKSMEYAWTQNSCHYHQQQYFLLSPQQISADHTLRNAVSRFLTILLHNSSNIHLMMAAASLLLAVKHFYSRLKDSNLVNLNVVIVVYLKYLLVLCSSFYVRLLIFDESIF